MLERASGSLANYPGHPPAAYGRLGYLVPDPILGAVKHVDFGELQQSGRKDTTRFFGTRSKVPMDWAALAIKPGRRSLHPTPPGRRRLAAQNHCSAAGFSTSWGRICPTNVTYRLTPA